MAFLSASSGAYTTRGSLAGVLGGIDVCLELVHHPSHLAASAPDVSAWSVQDHLEHLLFADREILGWVSRALGEPALEDRAESPNEAGVWVLNGGSIPRGRGPAPEFTLPTRLARVALAGALEALRDVAAGLEPCVDEVDRSLHTRPHHVLGGFTPAEWLRFLHIHHGHHEAIVRDILD